MRPDYLRLVGARSHGRFVMSSAEVIANVQRWNANPRFLSLSCRAHPGHPALVAVERDGGGVELACRACAYREALPRMLLDAWIHPYRR